MKEILIGLGHWLFVFIVLLIVMIIIIGIPIALYILIEENVKIVFLSSCCTGIMGAIFGITNYSKIKDFLLEKKGK